MYHRAGVLCLKILEQGSHPVGQALERKVLVSKHRVAAERRRVLRVDDAGLVRPHTKSHIRMPKSANIDRAVAGLLHIDQYLRTARNGGRLDRGCERLVIDLSQSGCGSRMLRRGERPLSSKEEHEGFEKSVVDLRKFGVAYLRCDIDAEDFRAECAC